MAKVVKKTAVKRRRDKKNIDRGAAHICSSFNNTIVTITDVNGNAISWVSRAPKNPLLSRLRWRRRQRRRPPWNME